MSASRKKVIIRLLSQKLHWGYLPAGDFSPAAEAELLLPDGRALSFAIAEVQHIAYVREFNLNDVVDPERMGFRSFPSKPRGVGVWVRAHFAAGDSLEGLVHDGLPFLDSLLLDRGLFLEPPDKRGNTQRVFIPRSALTGFEVLGVGGKTGTSRPRTASLPEGQGALFDIHAKSA